MNGQVKKIIDDFIASKGIEESKQLCDTFADALKWVNEHVPSDVFNLAAIGASDQETHDEQSDARQVLFQFLEKAVDYKKNPAVFLSKSAPVFKAQTFDRSDIYINDVHIYQSVQNLGIQEKYIRGLLTKTHWLTELDIQRQLKYYGLNDTIKIAPFTEPSLRATIDLAVRDHADAVSEYTVPVMLNQGSVGGSQGFHWLSAQVTIDPLGHKISYRIDDSLALSKEEKRQYKTIIEGALAAKADEFHNPFPTDAGWIIEHSEINGHNTQTDGYSCGYRALRQLLSNPAICGENVNATDFAHTSLDSERLVRKIFDDQLKDLSVSVDVFDSLSAKGQGFFAESFGSASKVKTVDKGALQRFLLGPDETLKKEADRAHKKIEAVVGAFTHTLTLLTFPNGAKDDSLTAVEYEAFFDNLHGIEQIGQSNLKRVNLPYVSSEALDGITSYFAIHSATAFKELGLFIDKEPGTNKEAFLSKFKLSIATLSNAGLEKIELRDEHQQLSADEFKELKDFAVQAGLACKIQLPKEYVTSTLQRELDRVIERNQQKKNNSMLSGEQSVTNEKRTTKSSRRREKLDFAHAKQVDIELQDSVEAEVAIEMAFEKAQDSNEFVLKRAFNLDDLHAAVRENDFSAFSHLKVMMSKQDFVKAWHEIFGNLVQGELQIGSKKWNAIGGQTVYSAPQISKISEEALQQLLREGHFPAGGIDFQNLPQGFMLINDDAKKGGRILHYDADYKKGALVAPLLADKQSVSPLIIDVVEQMIADLPPDHSLRVIWHTLNESAIYDANKSQIFREVVLDVLSLPRADQQQLIQLCGGAENLNLSQLKNFCKYRAELARLSKDPFDTKDVLNLSVVDQSLNLTSSDAEAIRSGLINLAAHAGALAVEEHPLLRIIKTDPEIEKQVRGALDKYHLTPATLNDLTRVYSSYGHQGVNKVLTTWDAISELKSIKPEIVAEIIANSDPLKDIILSQNLLEACKRLSDFSENKRQWFLQLYTNHTPKSDKNFIHLFRSFTEFSREIENTNQLAFYSLAKIQHPFTANTDMRTAMGRMITIMDACKKADLGVQWERIAEIDLGPNAAVNAVRINSQNRRCFFVIPEMQIKPDHEDLTRLPYDTVINVSAVAPKTTGGDGEAVFNGDDAETVQKRFFRYLAYQEHRMPVSFYLRAAAQIEEMGKRQTKIDRSELNTLYRLLAEVTTGKNYQHFIDNEQVAEEQWGNILKNIEGAQLKMNTFMYKAACVAAKGDVNKIIYKALIANLGELSSVPSIDVMDKLVTLMTTPITDYNKGAVNLAGFQKSMGRLNQSNYTLRQLTTRYQDKIYMGMKFYNKASYEKRYAVPESLQDLYEAEVSLFDHHTLVAFSLSQKSDQGFDEFAVPLISTFSLDHENIQGLYALHNSANSPIKSSLMANFGTILLDVKDNNGLNADSLSAIMAELLRENGVFAQIESSIKASFKEIPLLEEKLRSNGATQDELERYKNITRIQSYMRNLEVYTSEDDMLEIRQRIGSEAKAKMAEFLETNALLKAALPEGYADRLKSQKATGAVTILIDEYFKTQELKAQVEKIRAKFSELPEDQQLTIIRDISAILSQCDTESEKHEVAAALANQQLLSEGAKAYSNLLSAVRSAGSSPFVYYMQQAQLYAARNNDAAPLDGLCEKAAYFIGEAIPSLASRYKNLSILEFAPLISSVISAGRQEELSATMEVGDSFVKWQRASTSLLAAQTNPTELEGVLVALEPQQKSVITSLEALQVHLNRLKNPTITRAKIDTKEEEVNALGVNSSSGLTDYTFETRQVTQPTNALKRLGAFFGVSKAEETVNKYYKITTTYQEARDPDGLDNDLVSQVLGQIKEQERASVTYGHALTESMAIIDRLVEAYPSAKSMLLPLTKGYLEHKGDAAPTGAHIQQAYLNLKHLERELTVLDNKDMVISLCEHFCVEGKYNFTDLMTIFNGGILRAGERNISFAGYTQLSADAKKQLFTVITSLLNNKKTCELADIRQLITHFNGENGQQYLEAVTAAYRKAPYPELSQFNQWVAESPLLDDIRQKYNGWSKKPVAREDGSEPGEEAVNGFNLEYAKEQCRAISGITYTDADLQRIQDATLVVKDLTTDELLDRVKVIRANPAAAKQDSTELVAVMSELLYRTKGMPQEGIGNNRKWGNSFEINTTQYLAVDALLKSDKPTIAGIGTGEGKSRIMMISLAAQWALGRTVDFVTADVTLATRDYLEYQAYFKSFGAETNLITAQTPVDQYCKNGINFSDASNLSLFRNKARSQGLGDSVINSRKEDRCLLLDEADKTLFDTIDTRYNYSAQADQSIQDMPWIYESLVKFFKEPENEALFHGPTSDADECNRKFKEFAKAALRSEKDIQKLERVSRSQLESWQASAITALNLLYGKDFTLETNVPIVTKKGPGIVSQARLISGGAASKNAKFSFGVHQCLHARLNLERAQIDVQGPAKGHLLQEELSQRKYKDRRFPVDSENQIIYSSTSKALVDDYDVIRGVTGTPGAWTERAEKANMAFIDIPRHRGVNRIDRPYQLAKSDAEQFKRIIADIRTSIQNRQPILLICKDDTESKALHDYLEKNLTGAEKGQLHRVNADTSIAEEAEHVAQVAGKPGAITVTTARMGRGTDIKLHGDAKTNGLHVIGTYLPRERDYIQIIGRAGRFGAKGSSKFILSETSIRDHFSAIGEVPQVFYTATESYLGHLKMVMDVQAQKQRIIKDAVSDFRMNLTIAYFEKFFKPLAAMEDVNHKLATDEWRKFFDASDKMWNEIWPKISEALADKKMEQVERLLQDYHAEVQGYWKGMIESLKMDFCDNQAVDFSQLAEDVGNIKLSQRGIELLKYDVGTKSVFKTHIADSYDESYKGRAVILSGFWKNLWYNTLPSLFSLKDTPYTQARKNGNMTWSQFFLGGRLGTPVKTEETRFISALDDKTAMELVDIRAKEDSTAKIFRLEGEAPPKPRTLQVLREEQSHSTHEQAQVSNTSSSPSAPPVEKDDDHRQDMTP